MRGRWAHLLRYHPAKALHFYIKVFNDSADWYAHPRLHDRLEKACEVGLAFAIPLLTPPVVRLRVSNQSTLAKGQTLVVS